jgi:hypothetical protein
MEIYFFSSKPPASQRICKKNFTRSSWAFAFLEMGDFLLWRQIACDEKQFCNLDQRAVDFRAERVTKIFRYVRQELVPDLVCGHQMLDDRKPELLPWGGGLTGNSFVMKIQFAKKFEEIASVENLLEAWREFLPGKREKRDVQEFQLRLMDNILALH